MDPRVEIRHLRYFLAVADELHFGRAAERLHIAQPALSQQIRQLEKFVGVALFQRTSRRVSLTEAGAAFQPRARDLLERLSADLDEASRVGRGEVGRLDLAFITSATAIVSELLRAFARSRPEVQVKLRDGFTDDVLTALSQGTADVGIVRDAEERDGIALSPLLTERFVALVPDAHPAASGGSVSPMALRTDPLVLFPKSAGQQAFAVNTQVLREADIDVEVAQECSHWHTIIALVASGLGVTIAPLSVTTLLPPGVRRLEIDGPTALSRIFLATRQADERPLVKAFTEAPLVEAARG
jgi:DNA-binding transcriptional LysR family regulator